MNASAHDPSTVTPPILAYVGLGANLGDTRQTILDAAAALRQEGTALDLTLSPLYRTAPVESSGPDYVNAVARIHTRLEPHALLDRLQAIEQQHGRQRA